MDVRIEQGFRKQCDLHVRWIHGLPTPTVVEEKPAAGYNEDTHAMNAMNAFLMRTAVNPKQRLSNTVKTGEITRYKNPRLSTKA